MSWWVKGEKPLFMSQCRIPEQLRCLGLNYLRLRVVVAGVWRWWEFDCSYDSLRDSSHNGEY